MIFMFIPNPQRHFGNLFGFKLVKNKKGEKR